MSEIIAARTMTTLYIYVDLAVLALLSVLLLVKKRRLTFLFGLAGGLLYFLVDYGIFYLLLGTRHVEGANTALFLFWLSMSFGFSNFVWIWLWLKKDAYFKEFTLLIIAGWLCSGLLSQNFGSTFHTIRIHRGTGSYHGVMAAILFVGYAAACVYNLFVKDMARKLPLLWMLATGIGVQFGWEAALLLCGIRPAGIMPLVVNSLLETNLGIPYLYSIQKGLLRKWNEDLTKAHAAPRPVS